MAQPYNTGQTPFVTWINALAGDGYSVLEGTATGLFPGCPVFITAFGSCFGNNTATPYILTQPPDTPGLPSYAIMTGSGLLGTQPNNPSGSQATNDLFQVNPNDAIVTIITMPPLSAYFGYQTYALERAPSLYGQTANATCTAGTKLSQTYVQTADCNYEIFGDFTNTVNHADIIAAVSAFNGNPWNTYNNQTPPAPTTFKTVVVITTTNKTLAANMIALYTGDRTRIFVETMPASTKAGDVHTGSLLYPCSTDVRTPCDTFTSLIRDTLAQNGAAQVAWLTGNNVVTYRVSSPTVGTAPSNLYDTDDVYAALYDQG
jgi:hypothetical protein